jgi:hypothetical protein
MKIIFALLILCMIAPSLADPHIVATGPYNVSFDMGLPRDAFDINISEPKATEDLSGHAITEYKIILTDKTDESQGVSIRINRFHDQAIVPAQDRLVQRLKEAVEENTFLHNTKAFGRIIDGRSGAVSSSKRLSLYNGDRDFYGALYYLSPYGTVTITSTYPWDEGTLSLLKTIHVEMINETS